MSFVSVERGRDSRVACVDQILSPFFNARERRRSAVEWTLNRLLVSLKEVLVRAKGEQVYLAGSLSLSL